MVLLDTGSPSTYYIKSAVCERMLACGSASQNGWSETLEKKWGGFHGIPLIISSMVVINMQIRVEGGIVWSEERAPTIFLAAHARVVPDDAMTHANLLYYSDVIVGRVSDAEKR